VKQRLKEVSCLKDATQTSINNWSFSKPGYEGTIFFDRVTASCPPEYYADAAVVAFRLPDSDLSLAELKPKVTSSGGKFNLAALTDGDLTTSTLLPYTKPEKMPGSCLNSLNLSACRHFLS